MTQPASRRFGWFFGSRKGERSGGRGGWFRLSLVAIGKVGIGSCYILGFISICVVTVPLLSDVLRVMKQTIDLFFFLYFKIWQPQHRLGCVHTVHTEGVHTDGPAAHPCGPLRALAACRSCMQAILGFKIARTAYSDRPALKKTISWWW